MKNKKWKNKKQKQKQKRKQAGAELGQAQLKLGLDFNYINFDQTVKLYLGDHLELEFQILIFGNGHPFPNTLYEFWKFSPKF